jgi:hypothetical protein
MLTTLSPELKLLCTALAEGRRRAWQGVDMAAVTKALRLLVGACLSLVLLYCGVGMIMGIVLNRLLPAFPFSWVEWLNRPNIPPLADHVINFLLASMVATLFRDMWRSHPVARLRSNGQI